jgi:hypothetical protein
MFCGEGKVEDNILDLNDPFGELVNLLILLEEDAIPVRKIKATQEGGRLAIRFHLLDDQVRHGIRREPAPLDLLSRGQAEKLVSPLQVSRGAEHYRRGGASCHGVRVRREFKKLQNLVPIVAINTTAAREHMPEVERKIRLIKE